MDLAKSLSELNEETAEVLAVELDKAKEAIESKEASGDEQN